jgi:Tfp pilus assembly protein PilO
MKSSDRTILIALAMIGIVAGAWFLLLAPKRDEVAKLDEEIASVRASVQQQEELVAIAEAAKSSYDTDYSDLVVLGKAVPSEEDTSSLFVELEALADQSGAEFKAIELEGGTGDAPPPPAAAETTADESTTTDVPTAPVATEATAALLPIGATIGPAGLPVMPYSIKLSGDFFQIADFLASVDELVETGKAGPAADGRLVTVDGFELAPNEEVPGVLETTLTVTTYVAPADQGMTGGATPTAPATPPPPAAVPASNETATP